MSKVIQIQPYEGYYHSEAASKLDQWDKGQKLKINGLGITENVQVHFSLDSNHGMAVVVVPEITEDGNIIAKIPQYLLENEGATGATYPLYAWIYIDEGDTADTIKKIVLKVKTRPKPEDYVYTEEELKTWDSLEKRVKNLEENGGSGGDVSLEKIQEAVNDALQEAKDSGDFDGADGKSAYEYAQDGGYKGTEEEFAQKLAEEYPTKEEFSKLQEEILNLPKNEDGTVNHGTVGQFAVSDGNGGITWQTVEDLNEVSF